MRRALRPAGITAAVTGLGIATYLTVVHYSGGTPVCAIAEGCATVQESAYATLGGVPVALLGAFAYLVLLAALLHDGARARLVAAAVAFTGIGFSAWLTYVEVAILEAVCAWCVASAVCMAVLAGICAVRVRSAAPR